VWYRHRFRTTAATDLDPLWARLPEGFQQADVTVMTEPTRNAGPISSVVSTRSQRGAGAASGHGRHREGFVFVPQLLALISESSDDVHAGAHRLKVDPVTRPGENKTSRRDPPGCPGPGDGCHKSLDFSCGAHIQSFVDHPYEAVTVNRGALSDDPAIQAIIAEELDVVGQRLIDELVAQGCPRDATEIAVEGWLAFVRAACVKFTRRTSRGPSSPKMCLRPSTALSIPQQAACVAGYTGYPHSGDHSARITVDRQPRVQAGRTTTSATPRPNRSTW
jgi:hypothetical protein